EPHRAHRRGDPARGPAAARSGHRVLARTPRPGRRMERPRPPPRVRTPAARPDPGERRAVEPGGVPARRLALVQPPALTWVAAVAGVELISQARPGVEGSTFGEFVQRMRVGVAQTRQTFGRRG